MTSNWKVLNTMFVKLIKIYNYCFGQLSIWEYWTVQICDFQFQRLQTSFRNPKLSQIEKFLITKFVQLINIYNCCFGQLSIWDSLDGLNLWSLNFDTYKLVFGTLDCLQLKSFEYQVCSSHQDIQSLYRPFFHLRKFE